MNKFFWLSFADDSGFLGAAIVEAPNIIAAIQKAWELKINPGGEVKSLELPGATEDKLLPFVPNYLYSKAEIQALGGAAKF